MGQSVTRQIQNNFNAGELSPRLSARDDFDRYKNGCKTLENFVPLPHGGAQSRQGLHFVNEVKDSTKATYLIPFEFSNQQAYVIEAGNLYFRFYKDEGRIESPPGTPVELVTPYMTADLATLKFAQSADTLYIVHNNYAPRKLTRSSHTSWTLTTIAYVDGPYMDTNTVGTQTIKVSANTGTGQTMTAAGFTPFTIDHVGSYWRIKGLTNWGYVKVTAFTSSTVVTVDIINALDFATPGTSTTQYWREGAWSVKNGFPAAVTIFEQRVWFATTINEPQKIWGTTSASYEDMSPSGIDGTVRDSDAITYKVGSNKVNVIQWLAGTRDISIGTVGEELYLSGGSNPLTPTNARVKGGTTYGSNTVQALRIGSTLVFVQRSGRKLRQLNYEFAKDNYTSIDLSIFAEHMFRLYSLTALSWQQDPDNVLWGVRSDGTAITFTYLEVEQVQGWARHITDGKFESTVVIPSLDGTRHTAWFIVNRTIGGVTKRYIEFTDPNINVDCGLTYDGTKTAATLTPGATTGTNITFSTNVATFSAADVGRDIMLTGYVVVGDLTLTKWYSRATITAYTDTTHVQANILSNFPSTAAIPAGSWSVGVVGVTGLTHLEGKVVQVVGDGAVYTPQTVVSGAVSLVDGPAASQISAGLLYTCTLETLEPFYRDERGTIKGKKKHWASVEVALENTVGLKVNGSPLPFRKPSDPMDRGIPVYTGTKKISNLGWSKEGRLVFLQDLPMPATILAVFGELDIED